MFSNDSVALNDLDPAVLKCLSSILIMAAIFTIGGNIVIIIVIIRTPYLQKPSFIFTANITTADLLFSLFVLPIYSAALILKSVSSPFGAVICYIQVYVSNSTVAATVYFMAAIAVFRSLHVCYPVKYAKLCAPKWMITLCSTFWMVPLILCAAFDNGVEYDTNKFVCVFKSFRYLYALGLIVYVPSFSIMIIAYGKMFYTVKQCRRRIQAIGTVTTGAVIIHKDKHVFKMVIAITLIFLGSIGFPNLFYSVSLGCGSCRKCVMELIGSWLVRLRPTMNFIAILVTCRFLRNIVWSQICIYIESIFDMFI